jgi:hypothetical protein
MSGGEAAKIALKAIGAQDTFLLSGEPEDSLFHYANKQHSQFRKYHRSKNINKPGTAQPSWPFGETTIVRYEPQNMGDLLSNMWVSFRLPALPNGKYCDQIGRHMFRKVTMRVDEQIVEIFHSDWAIIYDELYQEISEKVAARFLTNRSLAYDSSELNTEINAYATQVIVPLNFFFSRRYAGDEHSVIEPNRPFFPTCAIHKQKIEFEFEWYPQTFFTDSSGTVTLSEFNIITEEITLTPDERLYFMRERQTIVTSVAKKHPVIQTEVGKPFVKNELVPNGPVKAVHWFFRNSAFEQENAVKEPGETEEGKYYIHNRFNFSSNLNYDEVYSFFAPVMDTAKFYIQGNALPNSTSTNHLFYKWLMPKHKYLSRPIRNLYTYAFATYPSNAQPSGYLDFEKLQGSKTKIECTLENSDYTYSLHMYYTSIEVFLFEAGKMEIVGARGTRDAEIKKKIMEKSIAEIPNNVGPVKPRKQNKLDHFLNNVKRFASM